MYYTWLCGNIIGQWTTAILYTLAQGRIMGTFPVDMKIDHLQYWLKSCGFDIMCSTQHYFDWINSRQKCFGLNQLHDGLDDELMPVLLLGLHYGRTWNVPPSIWTLMENNLQWHWHRKIDIFMNILKELHSFWIVIFFVDDNSDYRLPT